MAVLVNVLDGTDAKVLDFEYGVGIIVDHLRWCGLRKDAEVYFAEFNSRASIAENWTNVFQEQKLITEGKKLIKDFCKDYSIKFKEII